MIQSTPGSAGRPCSLQSVPLVVSPRVLALIRRSTACCSISASPRPGSIGARARVAGVMPFAASTATSPMCGFRSCGPPLEAGPAAIAGLTAHGALFCLERLGWDVGMRVATRARSRRATPHEVAVLVGDRRPLESLEAGRLRAYVSRLPRDSWQQRALRASAPEHSTQVVAIRGPPPCATAHAQAAARASHPAPRDTPACSPPR